MSAVPVICFGQQPCGFFPRRFLFAKIQTARRLQQELGGEIVFFYHDSDHDPRETRTLLRVPAYNWHWQLWYTLASPMVLPKGSKIECTAHFDNSPNNPDNADPAKEVSWGDQSWDEMMVGFFNLVFDARMPVKDIFVERTPASRN